MTGRAGDARPATWWPVRRRLALLALLTAVLTAGVTGALGATGTVRFLGAAYVAVAGLGLFVPAAVAVQVAAGVMLLGTVVEGGVPWPVASLLLGGVVFTAETLAAVARLDSPLPRGPGGIVPRALGAAGLGVGAASVVFALGAVPGPGGIAAVFMAAVACGVAGASLAR